MNTPLNYSKNAFFFGVLSLFLFSGCNSNANTPINFPPFDQTQTDSTVLEREVKIMPLGDSITEAFGYRVPLWDKLTKADYNINYVGSQSTPNPDLPDTDHEGHGGWKIHDIAEKVNGWLDAYKPDVILLMIGTNDVAWWTPKTGTEIAQSHAELVDQILANSSEATQLLVASIPPQSSKIIEPNEVDRAKLAKDFNAEMERLMQERIEKGKNIIFVDMYSQLSVDQLRDGIHPNDEGYRVMSQTWFDALKPLLD